MSDTDEPTIEGKPLSDLRVADLKKELELRSLAKSGNKSELMARLKEHILSTSLELSKNADQSVGDTDQCNTKKESCADNTLKLPELHGNGDTSDDAAKQIVEKQNKPDDADADADADSHLVKADKAVTKQQEDTAASTPIRSQSRESFISAVDSSVIYAATPMQPSNTATPISTPQKSDNEPAQTVQEPASAVKKTEESQVNQEVVNVSVTNGSTLGIEMDIGTEFDEPRAKLANSFTIEKPKDKDAVDEKSPIAPVQSSPAPVAPVTGATYATRNLRINRAPSSTTAVEENGEEQLATRTSRWGNSRAAVARERDSVAISAGSLNTILPTSATASSGTTVIKPTVVPQASSVIDEDPQVDTPTPIVPAPPVPVPVPVPVADDVKIDRQEAAVVQDTPKKMEHRKPVSEYVEVSGLVRPFSLPSLWTLLERSAHVDAEGASAFVKEDFWIDAIKSRCVVHYASVEYAQKARETLEALRWPPFNPAVLRAEFSSKELLDACRTGTIQTQRRVAPREREPPPHEKEPPKESQPQPQEESQSQDDTKKTVDAEEKPQQPINVLDSLFKKTAALPAIYWLPLTEEDALKRDEERLRKRLQQRTAKAEPAPAPAPALAPAPVPEPASRHRESPPTVRASAANERESARQRDGDRQPQPVRASAANEHESARQRDRDRQPQPGRPDARERWPNNREREERPRERFPAAPARFDAMRRTLAPFPLSGAPGHFDRDRERAQNNQFAAQAQTQAQANRWKEDSRQRNGNRRSEDKYKSKAKDTVANKRRRASSSSSSSSSSSDSSSSSSSSSSSDSRSSSSSSSSSSTSSSSPDRKRQRTRRSESTSSSDSDARGKRDRRPQAAARRGPAPVSSSRRH